MHSMVCLVCTMRLNAQREGRTDLQEETLVQSENGGVGTE